MSQYGQLVQVSEQIRLEIHTGCSWSSNPIHTAFPQVNQFNTNPINTAFPQVSQFNSNPINTAFPQVNQFNTNPINTAFPQVNQFNTNPINTAFPQVSQFCGQCCLEETPANRLTGTFSYRSQQWQDNSYFCQGDKASTTTDNLYQAGTRTID